MTMDGHARNATMQVGLGQKKGGEFDARSLWLVNLFDFVGFCHVKVRYNAQRRRSTPYTRKLAAAVGTGRKCWTTEGVTAHGFKEGKRK